MTQRNSFAKALILRMKFFPRAHFIGLIATLLIVTIIAFWSDHPDTTTPPNDARIVLDLTEIAADPIEITPPLRWESAQVRSGDNLSVLFSRHGLSAVDVIEIAANVPKEMLQLKPGQTLNWVRSQTNRIQRLQVELSPLVRHSVIRDDDGNLNYTLEQRDADYRPRYISATINNSLFVDGTRAGVPEQLIIELADIFAWDIDFAMDLRQGDSFSLIYDEVYLDGERIGTGNIRIARFHNQNRVLTAVRYTDSKGVSNYYTPEGNSMRKAFLRNPLDVFRISSRFNPNRRHPVLNTLRAHRGTDYAAPTGTPIKAAGDGRITFAGKKGAFGNVVIIQHGSRYETLYAHLSKFHRNAKSGRTIKQGQIIGYVGSTGLATGPHLHYEFRVDGVHRDSLRIALPKAEAVAKANLNDFLEKSSALVQWLDNQNETETLQIGAFQ